MFSEKKKIFETFFCSEVSVFTVYQNLTLDTARVTLLPLAIDEVLSQTGLHMFPLKGYLNCSQLQLAQE
jgi:hypothetical protein